MHSIIISFAVFVILSLSALATMFLHRKMRPHYYSDETAAVVRLIANIFVVMTSLVFGLMMNASKNTYEAIDNSVHAFATDIIVLDRTLRNYGPEAAGARALLEAYVVEALRNPTRGSDNREDNPDETGRFLDDLGAGLSRIAPASPDKAQLFGDIRQQYHNFVEERWGLIEKIRRLHAAAHHRHADGLADAYFR